jgi:hypothetical protein
MPAYCGMQNYKIRLRVTELVGCLYGATAPNAILACMMAWGIPCCALKLHCKDRLKGEEPERVANSQAVRVLAELHACE